MTQALITFLRKGGFADMARAYTLHVNGTEVGTIKRKSQLQIPVPEGDVTVEATIDWCKATPLTLTLNAGQTAVVEVSNTYGALKAAQAITTHQDTYLTLARLD